jgi:outer membrane protein TolC
MNDPIKTTHKARWAAIGLLLGSLVGCASQNDRGVPISMATIATSGNSLENRSPPIVNGLNDNPITYYRPQAPAATGMSESLGAPAELGHPPPQFAIAQVAYNELPPPENRPIDAGDPFAGQAELSAARLVAEVELRNPSIAAVWAAWRAAAERYPQVISLDDPMFGFTVCPDGAGREQNGGWMVEASQKIPWAGKRALRGDVANAEADAAHSDVGEARLRLAAAAKVALADYFMAVRQAEVNDATNSLLKQFRQVAKSRYEANQASEQDVLQADVELAELENRRSELARDRRVAVARINTLLHRAVDYPLPPPSQMAVEEGLPSAESLEQTASQRRPDVVAQLARIRMEEANLELACKDYYPDVEVVARYDAFMPVDIRSQVGMNLNIPLQRQRREAAVREVSARVEQRRAEYQDRLDQARFEVQSAFDHLVQQRQVIRLYQERILPATERSLLSAQANYTAGKVDFLRLIDAQRQFHSQREKHIEALADYQRRWAVLEQAVGQPLTDAATTR